MFVDMAALPSRKHKENVWKEEGVGHWRRVHDSDKRDGLLVRTHDCKWDLYFTHDESFSVEDLVSGIEALPLFAIGEIELTKLGRPHDHLGLADYSFRCRHNFTVMAGLSKHGNGITDELLT